MNTVTTLRKEAMTEAYEDVKKLVYKTAWVFWKRLGGEFDEIFSEANKLFIDAYDSYDDTKSEFTTWVVHKINSGLWTFIRKEWRRSQPSFNRVDGAEIYQSPMSKPLCIIELLDEMEKDSHIIMHLFMSLPKEFFQDRMEVMTLKQTQIHVRNYIQNHLKDMGWNIRRIAKSFDNIKKAIR